jgi:hypothetical protein
MHGWAKCVRLAVGVTGAGIGACACAGHAPPAGGGAGAPVMPISACVLVAPPSTSADSLRIAVTDALDPLDAPVARTTAERLVFPQLYDVPARLDCLGRAVPRAVASAPVADSLRRGSVLAPGAGGADSERPPADSALVNRAGGRSTWPEGTARYHVTRDDDDGVRLAPRPGISAPTLVVRRVPATMARDALDAGIDLLLTGDPTTIAYAQRRPEFISVPLPWDRVYVLMVPTQSRHTLAALDSATALRTELASDAVRVEAKPAEPQQWWDEQLACGESEARRPASERPDSRSVRPRIVYDRGDSVARALSERLVALANAPSDRLAAMAPQIAGGGPIRAAGLDAVQLERALAGGGETAYVVAFPVRVVTPCATARAIASEAPWLSDGTADGLADRIWPLVETRARAIVRRGAVGLTVDWVGDISLEPPARPAP